MSHYSCKRCGQRYEKCECPPAMTTDAQLPPLIGSLAILPVHVQEVIKAYGAACFASGSRRTNCEGAPVAAVENVNAQRLRFVLRHLSSSGRLNKLIDILHDADGFYVGERKAMIAIDNAISHATPPAQPTEPVDTEGAAQSVRIPTAEDEAALMILLGTQWLQQHAPHRLTTQVLVREKLAAAAVGDGGALRDRLLHEAAAWDAGSGDVAALLRKAAAALYTPQPPAQEATRLTPHELEMLEAGAFSSETDKIGLPIFKKWFRKGVLIGESASLAKQVRP